MTHRLLIDHDVDSVAVRIDGHLVVGLQDSFTIESPADSFGPALAHLTLPLDEIKWKRDGVVKEWNRGDEWGTS